ncbi:MtN3 and saliva related transmembrane protein [Polynucleobacter meluiroseus]|uniref:MtN3 and saliva related transmembrane protein n=1 Tax=Polynucleobacter meluiroseus TaxID=1938814 RepID=A0A240E0M6_9BURK|nr:SemiSWEET transporter [Polynucleobacter meluiroseus]SNX28061.1 MtN3 and saliva related transmembrane protein [Polynucleobacter meluiroseus]
MDFDNLLGFIAACLTTAAFIPQTYHSITTKDLSGISLGMYAAFTCGVVLWMIYGYRIDSAPILLANLITFVLSVTILYLKIQHQLEERRESKK